MKVTFKRISILIRKMDEVCMPQPRLPPVKYHITMITFNVQWLSFVYHLDVILERMVLAEYLATFIAHEPTLMF